MEEVAEGQTALLLQYDSIQRPQADCPLPHTLLGETQSRFPAKIDQTDKTRDAKRYTKHRNIPGALLAAASVDGKGERRVVFATR